MSQNIFNTNYKVESGGQSIQLFQTIGLNGDVSGNVNLWDILTNEYSGLTASNIPRSFVICLFSSSANIGNITINLSSGSVVGRLNCNGGFNGSQSFTLSPYQSCLLTLTNTFGNNLSWARFLQG